MRDIVALLPNHLEYDDWIRVGFVLKWELGQDGWPLWEAYSKRVDRLKDGQRVPYNDKIAKTEWAGLKPDGSANWGTIMYEIDQAKVVIPPELEARRKADWDRREFQRNVDLLPPYEEVKQQVPECDAGLMDRLVSDKVFAKMYGEIKKTANAGFQFVDVEILTLIWDRSFHTGDGKYRFLNCVGDAPVSISGERFVASIPVHFGRLVDGDAASEWYAQNIQTAEDEKPLSAEEKIEAGEDWASHLYKTVLSKLMLMIETTRQRTSIEAKVDMFASEARIDIGRDRVSYALTHEPFPMGKVDQVLIDDYKKHFPLLDDLLGLMVAARFARDRRKAFLWLRALSNWGKGFLTSILSGLGLVVEMKESALAKILGGSPADLSDRDFLMAWVVLFDEFKTLKGDLKSINNEINLSPKHQMRVTVKVYLKLFTSAEEVPALTGRGHGGVETQFARRFNYWHFTDGDIDQRDKHTVDPVAYVDSVRNYIARELNKGVEDYRKLGEADAARKAASVLSEFHNAHTIANEFDGIEIGIEEIARSLVTMSRKFYAYWIMDNGNNRAHRMEKVLDAGVPRSMIDMMEQHVLVVTWQDIPTIAIKQPVAFVADAVGILGGKAAQSLNYKVNEIVELMHEGSIVGRGVGSVRVRAAVGVKPQFTTSEKNRFCLFSVAGELPEQ